MNKLSNESFFQYVENDLVPSIRRDGCDKLANELERILQPVQTGIGSKIKYALMLGSELKDKRKRFLDVIHNLPEDYKFVINSHAKAYTDYACELETGKVKFVWGGDKAISANAIVYATKSSGKALNNSQ